MKIWVSSGLDEFIHFIRYLSDFLFNIEIALLILFTGLNLRRGVMMFLLQIIDILRKMTISIHPSNQRGSYDILIHEPLSLRITEPIWTPTENRIPFIQSEDVYLLRANEQWHIVKDPSGECHIGLVIEVVDNDNDLILCLDVLVESEVFYTFPISTAKKYLIDVAEEDGDTVILAADIQHYIRVNGVHDLPDFPVIVKTHWIRIIQRKWRRVYLERMRLLKLRGGIKAQRQFELSGKYGIPVGDGLRGMLYPLMSSPGANAMSANIKTD
jgi:hypothetical protein